MIIDLYVISLDLSNKQATIQQPWQDISLSTPVILDAEFVTLNDWVNVNIPPSICREPVLLGTTHTLNAKIEVVVKPGDLLIPTEWIIRKLNRAVNDDRTSVKVAIDFECTVPSSSISFMTTAPDDSH